MVQQVALLASVGYLGFAARGLRGVARIYGADQAWRENHGKLRRSLQSLHQIYFDGRFSSMQGVL